MKRQKRVRWIYGLITAVIVIASIVTMSTSQVYADPVNESSTIEDNSQEITDIVFVGDYVAAGMNQIAGGDESEVWITEDDKGLTWFKEKTSEIKTGQNTAVIITLGFNEVSTTSRAKDYVTYINSIASEWAEDGTHVYYNLVIPVDEEKYGSKINTKIEEWNETMKSGLSEDVTCIDAVFAVKDQYETKNDGYHFTPDVYKALYDYDLHSVGVLTPEEKKELEAENSKPKASVTTNGWGIDKDGYRVFYDEKQNVVVGWREIEGGKYCFDSEGHYLTGLQNVDNKTYFFNSIGLMRTGICKIDDEGHYSIFGEDGAMLSGWQDYKGGRYYINSDGWCLTGWWTIGTRVYYFKEDCSVARGITMIGEDIYYFDDDGAVLVGWQEIDGRKYYFLDGGKMAVGKTQIGDNTYYFDNTGIYITGWNAESDGVRYYDENGIMATGLKTIKDKHYYFSSDGLMQTGWYDFESGRCYFTETGTMAVGEAEIDGDFYYFDENGYMQTGIVSYPDGSGRFYDDSGKMKTGWQELDGKKYYITEEGKVATGCKMIDGKICLFSSDGSVKFSLSVHLLRFLILLFIVGGFAIYLKKHPEKLVVILEWVTKKLGGDNEPEVKEGKESDKKPQDAEYDDDDEEVIED